MATGKRTYDSPSIHLLYDHESLFKMDACPKILPLESKLDALTCHKANEATIYCRHDDIVEPCLEKPVSNGLANSSTETANVSPCPGHKPVSNVVAVRSRGDRLGMSQEVYGQHEERKPESIVEARLCGDDLTQGTSDVLVCKWTLGDGLGQDRIRAGDGGGDSQSGEERDLGHCGEKAGRREQPHERHDGDEAHKKLLLAVPDKLGRELVASNDELEADDDSSNALGNIVSACSDNRVSMHFTSVISDCCPSSFNPQFLLLIKLAAIGPRQMPMIIAGT
jgi:hypothetical protein